MFATPAVATFKFATRVVLVTVKGAVPTAILLINLVAVTLPETFRYPDVKIPSAPSVVSIPKMLAFPVELNERALALLSNKSHAVAVSIEAILPACT